jgi:hypothetical protein
VTTAEAEERRLSSMWPLWLMERVRATAAAAAAAAESRQKGKMSKILSTIDRGKERASSSRIMRVPASPVLDEPELGAEEEEKVEGEGEDADDFSSTVLICVKSS